MVKATIKQGDIVQAYRASCDDPTNIGIAEDVLFHMNDEVQEQMVMLGEIRVKPVIVIVRWLHGSFCTGVTYDPNSLRLHCPSKREPEPMLYCNDRAVEEAKRRSRRLIRTGRL